MKLKLITLLLIAYLLKELLWLAIIPIWHFPDEEQHFGQVAFWVEKNRFPKGYEFDVNREIDLSSEILGTKRDKRGINKFTYHPEYRTSYTQTQTGLYEEKIKSLNTQENREKMVKQEVARYGPVYYFLAGIPYKTFYKSDLLTRIFSSRLISIILSTLTVLITYLIAKELFKSKLLRLTLTFLVSFQPMFSFVSAGVNSDNLFNLIFSLILYSCLKIFFKEKLDLKHVILLLFSLLLGFYTKKQIFIAFPIILFSFLLSLLIKKRKVKKSSFLAIGSILTLFLILTKGKIKIPEYTAAGTSKLKETFLQYIFWHLRHTVAETIPWYWGVFNWLGVTLPRLVNQIQARILILAVIGILVYFIKVIKNKKVFVKENLKIIFLLGAALIYYFSVILWDYFFRQGHSFSFGIQGRYFFPTIVPHMLFIILGILALIPQKFKNIVLKVLAIWWFVFSLIGLHTATTAYYQLWPVSVFLNQVSQYKPAMLKAGGFSLIMVLFFISSSVFMIKFLKLNERKNTKNN